MNLKNTNQMKSGELRQWFDRTIIGFIAGILLIIGAAGIIAGGTTFFLVFFVPVLLGISGIILIYLEYAVKLWEQDDLVTSMAMVFLPLIFYFFSVLDISSFERLLVFFIVNTVIFLFFSLFILVVGLRVKWAVRKFVYRRYYYKKSQSPPAKRIPAIAAIFLMFGIILLVNGSGGTVSNISSITGGYSSPEVIGPPLNEPSADLTGEIDYISPENIPETNIVQVLVFPLLIPGSGGNSKISLFQDLRAGNGDYLVRANDYTPEDIPVENESEEAEVVMEPVQVTGDGKSDRLAAPLLSPVITPSAEPSPMQAPVMDNEVLGQVVPTTPVISATSEQPNRSLSTTGREKYNPEIPYPDLEDAIFEVFNKERIERKLQPFGHDALLSDIARAHSADMAERGYLSRTDPEGKSPTTRAMEMGFPVRKIFGEGTYRMGISESIGEVSNVNVTSATVSSLAELLVIKWIENTEDRSYLMNSDYDLMGVGIVSDGSTCLITVDVW